MLRKPTTLQPLPKDGPATDLSCTSSEQNVS